MDLPVNLPGPTKPPVDVKNWEDVNLSTAPKLFLRHYFLKASFCFGLCWLSFGLPESAT